MKLITQCASNKTISNTPKTEMVNFNHILPLEERIDKWLLSLNSQSIKTKGWDLYKGNYYKILNGVISNISSLDKAIISTGYGIIYEEDLVTDYMVTYALHIDKPTKINQLKGVNHKEWHNMLCQKQNKKSLTNWVNKEDLVLVILGSDYLNVIKDDLLGVYNKLIDKNNFIVISTSKQNILPNTLPIDGQWRKWLGGPQNAMGPNIFKKIMENNLPLNFEQLNNHFHNIYKPEALNANVKYTDQHFIDIIQNYPHLSQGKLIKKLRQEGTSISTGRMGRIFANIKQIINE